MDTDSSRSLWITGCQKLGGCIMESASDQLFFGIVQHGYKVFETRSISQSPLTVSDLYLEEHIFQGNVIGAREHQGSLNE